MVLEKRKTPNGSLIVGTDPSGLIMRVTPKTDGTGQGFVLFEAGKKEVTAVAVSESGPDAGTIYASAVGDKPVRAQIQVQQQGMIPPAQCRTQPRCGQQGIHFRLLQVAHQGPGRFLEQDGE